MGGRDQLLFFRWLCPFLRFCRRGFHDLLKVRPSSLLMLCGCISKFEIKKVRYRDT
jgi:hypothetical protein